MTLYLSVPPTRSAVHWEAVTAGSIGVIVTPRVRNTQTARWPVWAADNGCFSEGDRFDLRRYLAWLDRWRAFAGRCLFATAPDVLNDSVATWERSRHALARIRARGYRAALVAQRGIEDRAIEWSGFDVLFVGCTDDAWRSSDAVAWLVRAAKARGKRLHCGRVNSGRRFQWCAELGFDTADGTYIAFGPDQNVPRVLRWYERLAA